MTRTKTMAVLMAGAILALAGCGNDSEGPKQTVDQILSEAWADFAAGDYTTAADRFGDAVASDPTSAEARSGRGWSRFFLGDFDNADMDFAAGESGTGSAAVMADLYAGWAFLANADKDGVPTDEIRSPNENFILSNQRIDMALELSPAWSFEARPDLDRDDLIVLRAENYFALGDFAASLAEVQSLVEGFTADVGTPQGQAELAAKIEELSFTPMSGRLAAGG